MTRRREPEIIGVDRGNPAQGAKGRTSKSSLLFFRVRQFRAIATDIARVRLVLAAACAYVGGT
jgi:hypothetical protein